MLVVDVSIVGRQRDACEFRPGFGEFLYSQGVPLALQLPHGGPPSSHFTFRILHDWQPLRDLRWERTSAIGLCKQALDAQVGLLGVARCR